MLCHFIYYLFYFFVLSLTLFSLLFSNSLNTWGRNRFPDPLPSFLWNRICPFPFLDKAEIFQKERAFTQNKGRRVFLTTCPSFVLFTFNRSTWADRVPRADRVQRPQQGAELQSQRKSWARDRSTFLLRDRHMLSSPIILFFKNNFKNRNKFWPHFLFLQGTSESLNQPALKVELQTPGQIN